METGEIEKRIAGLERTQQRWRIVVVALVLVAVALNVVALVRANKPQPMFDDAALQRILHAIQEHDRGCATHATAAPASDEELHRKVIESFEQLYRAERSS